MLYLVLAYPKISDKDFDFIQSYRKEHDPKYYSVVQPHFTIVFPTGDVTQEEFITEVEGKARDLGKIVFSIRCATINFDYSGEYYHEFLVPDEGNSKIVKLHDRLYSGKFYKNIRFDIDFIPHIGIGNSEDVQVCKKNIDLLNSLDLNIEGTIEDLDIVSYDGGVITTIKKLNLK